jgi:transcriptional regulator with XRE-family HTH domain
VTPDQLKAARALLGWSFDRLAARSGTTAQLVSTFEKTGRMMSVTAPRRMVPIDAVAAVRTTLEQAGIDFTDGDAPGVRIGNQDNDSGSDEGRSDVAGVESNPVERPQRHLNPHGKNV